MKSVSKGAFLDMLKGAKTNVSVDPTEKEEMKEVSHNFHDLEVFLSRSNA